MNKIFIKKKTFSEFFVIFLEFCDFFECKELKLKKNIEIK